MFAPLEYQQRRLWRRKYPAVVDVLQSVFQLILSLVILGCEIGGDFVNFTQMNVFVGYWIFPFFMCAWISLAGASCCCRSRCCRITALVFQCLTISVALCGVGFDGYFLNNPTLCFFSSCTSYTAYNTGGSYANGYYDFGYNSDSALYSIKVPLVIGQLAAGALMFVSIVAFIIIFRITICRADNDTVHQNHPIGIVTSPYVVPLLSPVVSTNQVVCPNCGTNFQVFKARNDDLNCRQDLVLDQTTIF